MDYQFKILELVATLSAMVTRYSGVVSHDGTVQLNEASTSCGSKSDAKQSF